jgi:hemolysin type calcium-binding protein
MASALLVLASLAALPSIASAGTVSVSDAVVFTDPAGQDNRVDVDTGDVVGCETAWCVTIEDDVGAPASSDPRCEAVGADELLCQLAGPLPVVVDLGAGQDLLAAFQQPTDALTGRGGPGNDSLYSTTGPATLEGGDGDDELYPDDNPYSSSTVTPGPDVIAGGPGVDKVWYIGHASGVQVSLDGAANDGGVGEVDNVQTDVEAIVGSRSDDVLVGSDANNVFEGREGHTG